MLEYVSELSSKGVGRGVSENLAIRNEGWNAIADPGYRERSIVMRLMRGRKVGNWFQVCWIGSVASNDRSRLKLFDDFLAIVASSESVR